MVSSYSVSRSKSAQYSMSKLYILLSFILVWSFCLGMVSSHAIQSPVVSAEPYSENAQYKGIRFVLTSGLLILFPT